MEKPIILNTTHIKFNTSSNSNLKKKKNTPTILDQKHLTFQETLPTSNDLVFRYYYEPMSAVVHAAPPQTRRTFIPTGAYRRRVSVRDDGVGHYYTPEMIEDAYARMAYRSSPHLASSTRTSPPRVPSATLAQTVRKHPVTVRTPR